MRTILVTGGTGLVGKVLVNQLLQKNYEVIVLTRSAKETNTKNLSYVLWNVEEQTIDIDALKKADAIIHLAGAGVMDKKWTEDYKKEIENSRTKSAALIINTLKNIEHNIKVLVSSSAIGWYGKDIEKNHFFTEDDPADKQFLGMVCKLWEESVEAAEAIGIRVCKLRTGIVLSNDGAAYKEFKAPLKFGIASVLGSGKQIVSWIHIDDLCRQFIFALEKDTISGSYNAVAPMPVNNKNLIQTIAKKIRGKFFLTVNVPTFVLKIMLGERCVEILKSTTVSADKIRNAGFTFLYPSIEAAVNELEK